jgi:hypothetical protein
MTCLKNLQWKDCDNENRLLIFFPHSPSQHLAGKSLKPDLWQMPRIHFTFCGPVILQPVLMNILAFEIQNLNLFLKLMASIITFDQCSLFKDQMFHSSYV